MEPIRRQRCTFIAISGITKPSPRIWLLVMKLRFISICKGLCTPGIRPELSANKQLFSSKCIKVWHRCFINKKCPLMGKNELSWKRQGSFAANGQPAYNMWNAYTAGISVKMHNPQTENCQSGTEKRKAPYLVRYNFGLGKMIPSDIAQTMHACMLPCACGRSTDSAPYSDPSLAARACQGDVRRQCQKVTAKCQLNICRLPMPHRDI